MIVIVVDSMTGMGLKFAAKLGHPFFSIDAYVHNEGHQILLITRSVNFGDITEPTRQFLNQFVSHTVGVLVSDTEGVIDLVGVTDLVGVFVGSGVLELVGVALIVFVGVKVGVDVIGRLWGSLVPV